MQLSSIARATAFAGVLVACGAGGSGTVEVSGEPGGPFSGTGHPGSAINPNPGGFNGSGAPGPAGSKDATSLIAQVCQRAVDACPQTSVAGCIADLQDDWNELTTECARHLYYAFLTCLLGANFSCESNGDARPLSCLPPSLDQCGVGTGGTTTGSGGSGGAGGSTGGSGGAGGDTGGTGGSGGVTGGTGGSTGGSGGSTGGSGGSTGGTGGSGGRGGRGGGGPRDGGRG